MKITPPPIQIAIPYHRMIQMGVMKGSVYFPNEDPKDNYYGVRASLKEWPAHWILTDKHGWLEWWKHYCDGRRLASDDPIQISRWQNFGRRHLNGVLQASLREDKQITDRRFWTVAKQALLHWGISAEDPQYYVAFCADLMSKSPQHKLQHLGFLA